MQGHQGRPNCVLVPVLVVTECKPLQAKTKELAAWQDP